ncbi:ROK family protein [[Clostridium] cellulosi]|uniref:Glucokinase n=1 Tax=[Clostridium] cellulosi TaxID=29343 RepID=A0A078KSI0_9FIRM|nr:MAG: glucokinase [[Clostridium] cellulosi]CDZ24084.1 ROK family protein [[Clostridium] cellulosi]
MYYIGIDLGGTNIAAGIVDEDMNIVLKDSIPTKLPRSADLIIDDMAYLTKELLKKASISMDQVKWIGIGTPGTANFDTGIIEYSNNLRFNNVPMVKMMEERLGKKVFVENDANAAAYGEFKAGAAKGANSAVAITLGTGIGGGVIINKRILHGFNFAGGELGHTVIEVDGRECTCGRRGCWEAYASATGLINLTKESMKEHKDSIMWEIAGGSLDNVNGKTAFDAMRKNDEAGRQVVDLYIKYLGCGLINMINIFQPEVLCIGGGICKEGDNLIKPLEKIIEKERYNKNAEKQTKICVAKLGNDAGIIGAAFVGELYNAQ